MEIYGKNLHAHTYTYVYTHVYRDRCWVFISSRLRLVGSYRVWGESFVVEGFRLSGSNFLQHMLNDNGGIALHPKLQKCNLENLSKTTA